MKKKFIILALLTWLMYSCGFKADEQSTLVLSIDSLKKENQKLKKQIDSINENLNQEDFAFVLIPHNMRYYTVNDTINIQAQYSYFRPGLSDKIYFKITDTNPDDLFRSKMNGFDSITVNKNSQGTLISKTGLSKGKHYFVCYSYLTLNGIRMLYPAYVEFTVK